MPRSKKSDSIATIVYVAACGASIPPLSRRLSCVCVMCVRGGATVGTVCERVYDKPATNRGKRVIT